VRSIYIIGSLRNPAIPEVAQSLRDVGWDVFDDWYAAGPEADDYWQRYEKSRGRSYAEALDGFAANHVARYDQSHLDRCSAGLLVLPAGRSGHLELGYLLGQGKPGYILLAGEPDRFDVMYRLASRVFTTNEEMLSVLGA